MMDSFLSMWPKGLFGLNNAPLEGGDALMLVEDEERRNKRTRANASSPRAGSQTPCLMVATNHVDDESERPVKRFRGQHGQRLAVVAVSARKESNLVVPTSVSRPKVPSVQSPTIRQHQESPINGLPEDLVANCLSFLNGVEDRHSLQLVNRQFCRISNRPEMRKDIAVGGDRQTGLHGILQENDTPETATDALMPFCKAGNLEAIYMLGIIKSYCNQDVEAGLNLLREASSKGYVRASYALGLALRDSHPSEATKYMKDAADQGYIPALQEILPARKMKAKYGEPKADELRLHLDPLCLNRLLSRYYVQSAELRELNTSHCWNPLCGRWAFKAVQGPGTSPDRRSSLRRSLGFSFHRRDSDVSSDGSAVSEASHDGSPSSKKLDVRVSRMKMCSRCCRAKYCSKLCQVYDWRSGRHKMECQFL